MLLKWTRRIIWFGLFTFNIIVGLCCIYYYFTQKTLPNVEILKNVSYEIPLRIYSADGKLIGEFGEKRRIPLRFNDIPQNIKNAFLATEDARFYEHYGIDPIGITRAGLIYLKTGRKAQGASTLTQQIARNFFLTNKKTFTRKIQEIFIALKIEQILTKDEIFELYLNKIALGHHSYGIGAAAYVYFGKTVDQLTLGEAAIIAGLPKAPSTLNPISNPKNALKRRNHVLNRMLTLNMITPEEYETAKNEPIVASYHSSPIELDAKYVAESIRLKLESKYGESVYTDGYKVYSTILSKNQTAANNAVYKGLMDYDTRHGFRKPYNFVEKENLNISNEKTLETSLRKSKSFEILKPAIVTKLNKDNSATIYLRSDKYQKIEWNAIKWAKPFKTDSYTGPSPKTVHEVLKVGDLVYVEKKKDKYILRQIPNIESALVSIDTKDGAIKALVGGFSYLKSKFNRVEQAKRQAGSNIKPFLYSAALANNYSLATLMLDAPISVWNSYSNSNWSPKNSPNVYEGYIPLRVAIAKSKNVVSVRLIRALGIENFAKHLEKFGFEVQRSHKNDSLALGAYEVTPLELATGYAAFANNGYKIEPYLIDRIELGENNLTIYQANPAVACDFCDDSIKNSIEIEKIENEAKIQEENAFAPQIITKANAFLMSEALSSVIFGGHNNNGSFWGTGSKARELKRNDIAGKTGTTNQSRDAWFSGFSKDLATTVWVGFDDYSRPLGRGESGGKAALPIWIEYMKGALKDVPTKKITPPNTVHSSNIVGYQEYFMKDIDIIINSPYIEDADFSYDTENNSPYKEPETIDDLF